MADKNVNRNADLWESILNNLRFVIPEDEFKICFLDSHIKDRQSRSLRVMVASKSAADVVKKEYIATIRSVASRILGTPTSVSIQCPAGAADAGQQTTGQAFRSIQSHVNRNMNFDTFGTGPDNREAFHAARELCREADSSMSPLILVSPARVGKTHLLHAIANQMKKDSPRVLYISMDKFITKFAESIRPKTTNELKSVFYEADFLLIDDLQLLERKPASAQFFAEIAKDFHVFDKPLVLASKRNVEELDIRPEIKSYLIDGANIPIAAKSRKTRKAIYRKFAERANVASEAEAVKEEIINLFVRYDNLEIDEVSGIIKTLATYARVNQEDITVERTKAMIGRKLTSKKLTPAKLLKEICEKLGVAEADLLGKTRRSDVVAARRVATFHLKQQFDLSLTEIAKLLNRDNRQSVTHYYKRVKAVADADITDLSNKDDLIVKKLLNEVKVGAE